MNIKRFLDAVTSQIRSKEARAYVKMELSQHLKKSKNAWVEKGYSELDAEEKAVQEMGNPTTLGRSLNQLHKPKVDWWLILLLSVTLILSFLPLTAILHQEAYVEMYDSGLFLRKGIVIVLGLLIVIGMMFFDYRRLEKFGYPFCAMGAGLIFAIQLFGNTFIHGELAIVIGQIEIQAWMAIPLYLVAWASLLNKLTFKLWQFVGLFVFSMLLFLSIANLLIPFIYMILVGVLFLQSRFTRKEKVLVIGTGTVVMVGIIVLILGKIAPYQINRLSGFMNPKEHASGSGYQYILLEQSLKNAGLFGAENVNVLPNALTEMVFGNVIQTYGFVIGFVIFIVLFALLARMWMISFALKDSFGKGLVIGSVTLFATQFLYSVGMTFGKLPITSMPLPFMSNGLMPTILNAFIVGIVLSVYRRKHFVQKVEEVR